MLPFLFHNGSRPSLATPFPSVRTGDLPWKGQRFAAKVSDWRGGAVLRGENFGLTQLLLHPLGAPFRGAVGGSRLRGHQSRDVSRVKKKEYITRNNVIRDGTAAVPYDGAFSAVASDAPPTCVYPPFR